MKQRMKWWLGAVLISPTILAAQTGAPATSVTLFNSGRVLVRRTLPMAVPNGSSTQALHVGLFDPVSLFALEPGVTISGIRFDPSSSEDALIRRSVGRQFQFLRTSEKPVSATLIALDPERWRYDSSGKVVFSRPGQILWPAELVPTAPVTEATVRSDRARQGIRVMYETSGAMWSASYRIFLGSQGRVEGNAAIGSGSLDLADVEVQLLAGDIGRAAAPSAQRMAMAKSVNAFEEASAVADAFGASEESIGEAHLYTLPGPVSFLPGLQLTVPLFEPVAARAERRYTVAGSLQFYGGLNQEADEREVLVAVAYRLERKAGTPFGDLAIPAGSVAIFDADKSGRMQLVGQGGVGHTAPNAAMLVNAGSAFDVTAKRVQTEYSVGRTATVPIRSAGTAAYRVTLQNAKDSAVTVEVREDRAGEWSILDSSLPPEKRSSTRTVFTVTVPAKGTTILTYRIRVVW